jgi:hypothetical protein
VPDEAWCVVRGNLGCKLKALVSNLQSRFSKLNP